MLRNRMALLAPVLVFCVSASVYATPLFTPAIDGIKESGWDSTPDTNSVGYGYDGRPCTNLYVTDDPNYLYIGYEYGGDYYTGDGLSGHTLIMLDTTNNFGAGVDPYMSSNTYSSANFKPDFGMRSWDNNGNHDVQFVKWNGTGWTFLGSFGDAEHFEDATKSGAWAEIRFPLATLGLQTGDTVKICYYWRCKENTRGFSSSTPWNSTASSGSASAGDITAYYTYTIRSDNIKPVVVSNFPANAAAGQEKSANIVTRVSDNVDFSITNIHILVEGNDAFLDGHFQTGYTGTVVTNTASKDYTITVNPDVDFEYEQHVNVEIYASDAAGNTAEKTFYFDVRSDNVAPAFPSIAPLPGSTGNSCSASLQFLVSDDDQVDADSIVVKIDGNKALSNAVFQPAYNGTLSQIIPSGTGYSVTLDFTNDFYFAQVVAVSITAKDLTGNPRTTNFTFTVAPDSTKPLASAFSPVGGGNAREAPVSFRVTDNDRVVSNSIFVRMVRAGVTNVVLTNGQFGSQFTGSYSNVNGGYAVRLVPKFQYDFEETVTNIVSCADPAGNTTNAVWAFAVVSGDVNSPTISKLDPYNGEYDVEPDTPIYFETGDDVGVVKSSIHVILTFPDGSTNVAVAGGVFQSHFSGSIVSNANRGFDVTIDYDENFEYTNTYTVNATIEDTTANEKAEYWSFTVRPPDTTPPQVAAFNPADGAQDIAVSASINFQVTDNYNVLSNKITAWVNGTLALSNAVFRDGYAGAGSSLIGNDGNGFTVLIDPESDFTYGQTVTVIVKALDTSSNTTVVTNSFQPLGAEQAVALTSVIIPSQNVTAIRIKVNRTGNASVVVYNIRGETVAVIPEKYYDAGDVIVWDGTMDGSGEAVAPGWYFVALSGSDISTAVKVMIVR